MALCFGQIALALTFFARIWTRNETTSEVFCSIFIISMHSGV